jgi:hypothetical protein
MLLNRWDLSMQGKDRCKTDYEQAASKDTTNSSNIVAKKHISTTPFFSVNRYHLRFAMMTWTHRRC